MTEETKKDLLCYLCYLLFHQSTCKKIVLDGGFEQERTEETEEESLGLVCPIHQLTAGLVPGRIWLDTPSDGMKTSNRMGDAPQFSLLSPVQSIRLSYANGIWLADLDADAWKLKVHHGFLQPFGSILEQFAELKSDYEIGKASRYKRAKTGIMTLGSHADYHYRTEAAYFGAMKMAREMTRNNPLVMQGVRRLQRGQTSGMMIWHHAPAVSSRLKVTPSSSTVSGFRIRPRTPSRWAASRSSSRT